MIFTITCFFLQYITNLVLLPCDALTCCRSAELLLSLVPCTLLTGDKL